MLFVRFNSRWKGRAAGLERWLSLQTIRTTTAVQALPLADARMANAFAGDLSCHNVG